LDKFNEIYVAILYRFAVCNVVLDQDLILRDEEQGACEEEHMLGPEVV